MAGPEWESPSSADLLRPGCRRSWDLNKICYKSGVPLIENGMIERVSVLGCPPRQGGGGTFSAVGEAQRGSRRLKVGVGVVEGILQRSWGKEPRDRTDGPGVSLADDREAVPVRDPHPTRLLLGGSQTPRGLCLLAVSVPPLLPGLPRGVRGLPQGKGVGLKMMIKTLPRAS